MDFYKLNKKDVKTAARVLARAFHNDPAWIQVVPEEELRFEKFSIIFQVPLLYAIKYGDVYAPSPVWKEWRSGCCQPWGKFSFWRVLRSGGVRAGMKMGRALAKKNGNGFQRV